MMMTRITRDQSRDTGMAMVLLLLLGQVTFRRDAFLLAALVLHVANMVAPQVFRPVAVVWLGASHVVGAIVSRVLLSIVYALVVTPVGILRRAAGKDALRLRAFRVSDESVMVPRNHRCTSADLEKPY